MLDILLLIKQLPWSYAASRCHPIRSLLIGLIERPLVAKVTYCTFNSEWLMYIVDVHIISTSWKCCAVQHLENISLISRWFTHSRRSSLVPGFCSAGDGGITSSIPSQASLASSGSLDLFDHMSTSIHTHPTRKTPESFLGPNAALVNLDSLVTKPAQPPPVVNPFLASTGGRGRDNVPLLVLRSKMFSTLTEYI